MRIHEIGVTIGANCVSINGNCVRIRANSVTLSAYSETLSANGCTTILANPGLPSKAFRSHSLAVVHPVQAKQANVLSARRCDVLRISRNHYFLSIAMS